MQELRASSDEADRYAIDENLAFFAATRNLYAFLVWLAWHRRRIDAERILEVGDFGLPRWQGVLQRELSRVSQRRFPGLVEPLVVRLVQEVLQAADGSGIVNVLSLGCGAMEIEAQLLARCGIAERLRVIGCDSATTAFAVAGERLERVGCDLVPLSEAVVGDLPPGAYLYRGEAADFLARCEVSSFDVLFHARLRHHLPSGDRARFDADCRRVARRAIEYDDYQCLASLLGPVLTAWRSPILLNGAILSWVRGRRRAALRAEYGEAVSFHNPPGTYLRLL